MEANAELDYDARAVSHEAPMHHPTFNLLRSAVPPLLLTLSLAAAVGTGSACAGKKPPGPPPAPPPVDVNVPAPPARPMPTVNRQLLEEVKKAGLEAREVDEGVIIYLPTVFLFEFDQSVVTQDARKKLLDVGKLLI